MRRTASCYWRDGDLLHIEIKCPKCQEYIALNNAELILTDGGEMTVHGLQAHNSPNCNARFRIIGSEIIISEAEDGKGALADVPQDGDAPQGHWGHTTKPDRATIPVPKLSGRIPADTCSTEKVELTGKTGKKCIVCGKPGKKYMLAADPVETRMYYCDEHV